MVKISQLRLQSVFSKEYIYFEMYPAYASSKALQGYSSSSNQIQIIHIFIDLVFPPVSDHCKTHGGAFCQKKCSLSFIPDWLIIQYDGKSQLA